MSNEEHDGELDAAIDRNPPADSDTESADMEVTGRMPVGVSVLIFAALFTLLGVGLHAIQDVFTSVFFGLTLVLAFRPLGRWLLRKGVPAWISSTITIFVLTVTLLGMVGVTIWSLTPVPQTLINYSQNFEDMVNRGMELLTEKGINTQDFDTYLNEMNFNSIVSWAWQLVDSLSSVGGIISIVVVAMFFLVLDTMVAQSRTRVMNVSHSNLGLALGGFERRVRQYWIVSTVFGVIVALLDVLALHFLGIPLAITWGVWAWITNYIPNVGFIIGVVPPMLMALLDQGWQSMVWVLVWYIVFNTGIQTFIQPKFTGDIVGLSPTVTFLSLVLWTAIVGMFGSILAVPLTLFFKALLVDSDPRTRWLDVFLISEAETERRRREGYYDVESPDPDDLVEEISPFTILARDVKSTTTASKRRLSSLTRKLKAARKDSGRAPKEPKQND